MTASVRHKYEIEFRTPHALPVGHRKNGVRVQVGIAVDEKCELLVSYRHQLSPVSVCARDGKECVPFAGEGRPLARRPELDKRQV